MIVLEKAHEFHRHVEECVVCTTGCREAIFCVRGWRLLLGAMDEAFALAERGVAANLAAPTAIAAPSPTAIDEERGSSRQGAPAAQRGRKRENGVTAAAEKLRGRMDSSQELAPSESVTLEGGAS